MPRHVSGVHKIQNFPTEQPLDAFCLNLHYETRVVSASVRTKLTSLI